MLQTQQAAAAKCAALAGGYPKWWRRNAASVACEKAMRQTQSPPQKMRLLDHLVGAGEHRPRNVQAKGPRYVKVDQTGSR
jgi:hypothetical protein